MVGVPLGELLRLEQFRVLAGKVCLTLALDRAEECLLLLLRATWQHFPDLSGGAANEQAELKAEVAGSKRAPQDPRRPTVGEGMRHCDVAFQPGGGKRRRKRRGRTLLPTAGRTGLHDALVLHANAVEEGSVAECLG